MSRVKSWSKQNILKILGCSTIETIYPLTYFYASPHIMVGEGGGAHYTRQGEGLGWDTLAILALQVIELKLPVVYSLTLKKWGGEGGGENKEQSSQNFLHTYPIHIHINKIHIAKLRKYKCLRNTQLKYNNLKSISICATNN